MRWILLLLVLAGGADVEEIRRPRNVIVLISDGMGYRHAEAASLYRTGERRSQAYWRFPVRVAMSTYAAGNTYLPCKAAKSWKYLDGHATDSGAAGTAMACGVKTKRGMIGMTPDKKNARNVVEVASLGGKATGVVTTVQWNHATPASFVAHAASRDDYGKISKQMLESPFLNVLIGCTKPRRLIGGRTQVWGRNRIRALATGDTPRRLLVVGTTAKTLQQERDGAGKAPPYRVPFDKRVANLPELTAAALNALDDDPDGFFLMIEGGAVDWAGHDNQLGRMIEEQSEFDDVVDQVLDWATRKGVLEETLIVVTADHECGYLTGPKGKQPDGTPWWRAPLPKTAKGTMPKAVWNTTRHTNALVPFFAWGPGSRCLLEAADQKDPIDGLYLDNTELGTILKKLVQGEP